MEYFEEDATFGVINAATSWKKEKGIKLVEHKDNIKRKRKGFIY